MEQPIGKHIESRIGHDSLIETLSEKLSGSELNSLLLEVFARRSQQITPGELLKQYSNNRFVHPAETNFLNLMQVSMDTLRLSASYGFEPIHLSPLSQFGTSSVIACVDQNKVVSATRGCEVLSDATNAIALHVSHLKKNKLRLQDEYRFSAVPRHVRAQAINIKGFAPHFTVGCLAYAGTDTGNFDFEKKAIAAHFVVLKEILETVFRIKSVRFKLHWRAGYADHFLSILQDHLTAKHPQLSVTTAPVRTENNYYKGVQFKVIIPLKDQEIEIADGGFVDWTQKLLNNRKERFCISGFGLELLRKAEEGLM